MKEKSLHATVLIIFYVLAALANLYSLIVLLTGYDFSSIGVSGSIFLRICWFVAFWAVLYLLGTRKKFAYKAVISLEVIRAITTIIILLGMIQLWPQFSGSMKQIIFLKAIGQIIIIPALLIWLVNKSKKVLIN